ncbi:MAG: pseudouridine synthase, partial [Candidatus Latescibacteria bacterium]|nr:pseudouridine synthase [Candidatus Latescibacterota bacterium]
MKPLNIIYLDNHLLVVRKPAGLLVQGDHTGDPTLLEQGKLYLKDRFNKPGKVFLGLVHRIDRPVSGVVVLARTS